MVKVFENFEALDDAVRDNAVVELETVDVVICPPTMQGDSLLGFPGVRVRMQLVFDEDHFDDLNAGPAKHEEEGDDPFDWEEDGLPPYINPSIPDDIPGAPLH